MDADELIDRLEPALSAALGDDGFDLERDDESDAVELATDEWTLVLEAWPDGIGFLAVDDEPSATSEAELMEALTDLIGKAIAPLRSADRSTNGAITTALTRTSDPVSNTLAKLLKS